MKCLSFLGLSLFLIFSAQAEETGDRRIFATAPYLQNPVDNGVTVSWVTRVPVYGWVEYGEDPQQLKKVHTLVDGQVICNDFIHKIRLEPLIPGKTYYYRVCSREILSYKAYSKEFGHTAVTEIREFRLPSPEESDFTALIFNDIHKKHELLDALFEQVKEYPYDLVFFNGDCIDDPADQEQAVRSIAYYNRKVGADRIPVFYLRGNHEIRNAYSIGLRELFDYVGDKTYGAFNWGDTRFVMLDCGEDKPDDHPVYYGLNDFAQLRLDQAGFLKREFASKAFKKSAKKVLIHHIPIYRSSLPDADDDRFNPCKELWGDLLSRAPFQVALNGHTHRFAHIPAGTDSNPFPVVVGGGNSLERATVMVLQRQGKQMTLRVLNTGGEELLKLDL
jgi:predicted phosphodiesterase